MRRIYFLVPSIDLTRRIVDELLLERVDERHIHVLGQRGAHLENLPEASFLQKTDFVPALEQGVALGGVTGLLAGLVAVALPTGLVLGGGAVLMLALAGAGVGGLASSLIGSGIGSRHIEKFQEALDRGDFLVMVDVPKDRVEAIETVIKRHHPEAECERAEVRGFP